VKARFFIVVLLVVAGAAVFLVTRSEKPQEEGVLVVSGNVEVTEMDLGFTLPGRVIALLAEEGQFVEKGSRLARLDNAEIASQVSQNKAALDEARTRLQELKAGSRRQELEQAKANVSQAEADLSKAAKDFERAQALFRDGVISAQERDAARKTYDVARAQHRSALENLSLVKEGPRTEEIQAAQNRVSQAEAALKESRERLRNTFLDAPTSGVILSKNVELGETVAAGVPVYTLGDLSDPWIKVYVKEDKLGLVKLGQKAVVSVDSYPGKTYDGTVSYISSEAEFTPKNVQTQEERVKLVFGVKVRVKNVNNELKPGMPADVNILVR
jgi:HlyD family secretion protein